MRDRDRGRFDSSWRQGARRRRQGACQGAVEVDRGEVGPAEVRLVKDELESRFIGSLEGRGDGEGIEAISGEEEGSGGREA